MRGGHPKRRPRAGAPGSSVGIFPQKWVRTRSCCQRGLWPGVLGPRAGERVAPTTVLGSTAGPAHGLTGAVGPGEAGAVGLWCSERVEGPWGVESEASPLWNPLGTRPASWFPGSTGGETGPPGLRGGWGAPGSTAHTSGMIYGMFWACDRCSDEWDVCVRSVLMERRPVLPRENEHIRLSAPRPAPPLMTLPQGQAGQRGVARFQRPLPIPHRIQGRQDASHGF